MVKKVVEKDERTTFFENVSFSYGYKFLTFALLFDIAYKSFRFNESSWDLFAIMIASGFIMTVYQYHKKILGKSWIRTVAFAFVIAIIAAVLLVLIALTR
jgi:phosphoglycerol transferase MdoB-like AlkP superfamily enzyme